MNIKNKNFRILLILTEFPPKIGGMQTHAYYLAQFLSSRGHDIEVITYIPEDQEDENAIYDFDLKMSFSIHRCLSRLSYWNNLKLLTNIGKKFSPDLIYSSTVFYGLLELYLNVPVLSRSVGNDVLRPWIAYPFKFGSTILCIRWIEQNLYNFFKRLKGPDWIDTIFRKKRYNLLINSIKRITHIFANSDFTAQVLQNVGVSHDRIEILVGGVDADCFAQSPCNKKELRKKLAIPANKFILLTACRFVEKKGIDFLIEVLSKLHAIMPDCHLLIVGDGPCFQKYQRIAKSFNIDESITFAGKVPHNVIQEYFWSADIFVLASKLCVHPRLGVRDAETMGRVLCEANAAGIPVIASRCGGIPSVIVHEKNGLLFEPNDYNDFINQIIRLRKNRKLTNKLIINGKKMAKKNYDWSVILDNHERAFNKILHNNY